MGLTIRRISFLLITSFIVLILPAFAYATSAYLTETGNDVNASESPDIALEKLVIQMWLHRGFAEVEEVYQFKNTGESQEVLMGLPEVVNTKASLEYGLYNFSAYVDGKPADSRTVKMRDQKVGSSYGNINWHVNSFFIQENKRRIVVHKYWVRLIPWENKLIIPLDPASTWKGKIGEVYYVAYLQGDLSERDVVYPAGFGDYTGKYAIIPAGFTPSKSQMTWIYSNYKPRRNMQIQIFPSNDDKLVKEALASGWHQTDDNAVYPVKNAIDGDPATSWGYGGPGKGDWYQVKFAEKKWIREFRIIPGYAALDSMFRYYNRPRDITLILGPKNVQRIRLKDGLDMQYFAIKPVHTEWIRLHVDSVYKGIYPDVTYISELEFGQLSTASKVKPAEWRVGLDQLETLKLRPRYSMTELITMGATALVFLFILWQVIVALRIRRKTAKAAK